MQLKCDKCFDAKPLRRPDDALRAELARVKEQLGRLQSAAKSVIDDVRHVRHLIVNLENIPYSAQRDSRQAEDWCDTAIVKLKDGLREHAVEVPAEEWAKLPPSDELLDPHKVIAELRAKIERLRETAECPPDSPLEQWVKVLVACWNRENARRHEHEQLWAALGTTENKLARLRQAARKAVKVLRCNRCEGNAEDLGKVLEETA